MASVRQQTFSTQSCGGRNRTCVGMINSHLPVPTRAPPQSKLLPENRRHPWLAWEKSTQRESNPHFRPGKAAGCPYIMGAFLSSWSSCQRSKNYESTGWDSNPRFRITGAESWPLNDPCLLSNLFASNRVGPEGLEPSPTWLRARHAAANTLIPHFDSRLHSSGAGGI